MIWTASLVEDRLAEAADTLYRLPEAKIQGHASTWPSYVQESWSIDDATLRRPPPSAAAITRMDETLLWFQHLDPVDAKIVWKRADGKPWKVICWEVGMTRSAAHRHWLFALCVIAWKLNGRRIPKHITKADLIARTKAMDSQPAFRRTQSEMTMGGIEA